MSCSESLSFSRITRDGLWDQNVVFSQLLAMCPTMAVTTSGTNGLGMGLATTAVLVVSNMLIALIRDYVSDQVRIPVFVVVIATLVTLVDMSLNAWVHGLHKVLRALHCVDRGELRHSRPRRGLCIQEQCRRHGRGWSCDGPGIYRCADDRRSGPRTYRFRHLVRYNKVRQPNRNRLLTLDSTVDGMKTGHTNAAGYCLVSSARGPRRLISVVMRIRF